MPRIYHGIMRFLLAAFLAACAALITQIVSAQIIPFESNGLQYKTLTKGGVTVMFAPLPAHLKEYSIMQVSLSNGSPISWTVKPEDFSYRQSDGTVWQASTALSVVNSLLAKVCTSSVVKPSSVSWPAAVSNSAGVRGASRGKTRDGLPSTVVPWVITRLTLSITVRDVICQPTWPPACSVRWYTGMRWNRSQMCR